MTTSRITARALARPLPSARDKTFKIEAERLLKECEQRLEQFTKRVSAHRGES